jgi:hypothetical protein
MFRYKDLYDHVLFNYQWLYAKMCAVPLPEVLGTVAHLFVNLLLFFSSYYLKFITLNKVVKGSVSRGIMIAAG